MMISFAKIRNNHQTTFVFCEFFVLETEIISGWFQIVFAKSCLLSFLWKNGIFAYDLTVVKTT